MQLLVSFHFVDHMENITPTAKQRMYIVRLFYNLGSKQLASHNDDLFY